jgi:hypothetical protein
VDAWCGLRFLFLLRMRLLLWLFLLMPDPISPIPVWRRLIRLSGDRLCGGFFMGQRPLQRRELDL